MQKKKKTPAGILYMDFKKLKNSRQLYEVDKWL